MKKTLAIIALAAPALAGTKPTAAPAPTPAPAPVVSPWAVELGAGYNKAAKSPFHSGKDWFGPQKKVNTWSWDLTGVYKLDENNALTLRLGYAYGNRQQEEDVRLITNPWSLMPGYRYTYALSDKWSAFAGANVGLVSFAWLDKEKEDLGNNHKSGWGFGYSAELGVRYAVCGNWDAFVAYHFSGDTASPRYIVTRGGQSTSIRPKKQNFHGVRIGVGCKF